MIVSIKTFFSKLLHLYVHCSTIKPNAWNNHEIDKKFYYISCEIFWDNIINNQSNGEKKELNIMIRKADGLNTVQPEVEYY